MTRIVSLCLLLASPGAALASPGRAERADVVVLHSYGADYEWTRNEQRGVEDVFLPVANRFQLRIEYMDSTRAPDVVHGALLELYRRKFARVRPGVVLASDNAAFDFLRDHADELFPGVPVVFMGVNGFDDAMLAGHERFTGVAEDNDFLGVFEAALRLQPDARRIVLPGSPDDATYAGNVALIRKALDRLPAGVRVEFPPCATLEACTDILRALPREAIALIVGNPRTADGGGVNNRQAVEIVSPAVSVPLYTAWEFSVGHGTVGGKVMTGTEQGRLAAEIALRVLDGERPSDIPVRRNVGNTPMFDYLQLRRFGLDPARLPAGSVVINSPDPTYRVPREAAWTAVVSLVALAATVLALAASMRRRRRAEANLTRANRQLEAIIEFLPDPTLVVDQRRKVVAWNRAMVKMTRISRDEMLGRDHLDAARPFYGAPRRLLLDMLDATDEELARVYVAVERSGNVLHAETFAPALRAEHGAHLSVTASALLDAEGGFGGAIESLRDVTDRKILEQQLLQSQKMETVGLLAGGIAHDFNNLLTPIITYSDLLLLETREDEPRREWLADVNGCARRASDLTRQLLAFGRCQMLQLRTLDLGTIVHRFESILRRTIEESVRIELRVAPDLGAVRADAGQIEQVLLNLAVNARDAMADGGILTISARNVDLDEAEAGLLAGLAPGPHVRLEVRDTGTGMTDAVQARLFEPFFTTKQKSKGSGLGLSTVYGIVRQHGGAIAVHSRPGAGSTFEITLPRAPGPADAPAGAEDASPPSGPAPGGHETILVVEDNDSVRVLATDLLARLGYRVLQAENGQAGLHVAEEFAGDIHLALTDVIMPEMNGKEFATRLASRRVNVKVLYMSGYASDAVVHRGVVDEGVHFLQKPLSLESLSRKIRAVLDA